MTAAARAAALSVTLIWASAAAAAAPDWISTALGDDARGPSAGPQVRAGDLIALRDLGGLSVSPDGRWLAVSVRQAVEEEDRYVLRWIIAPTDGRARPTAVPVDGGQPILLTSYGLPQAHIPPQAAPWSPDGQHIAFRRKVGDRVELWTAGPASPPRRVWGGAAQVEAFAWSSAGRLVFRTGLDLAAHRRAVAAEALHGWRLDGRMPLSAARTPEPTPPNCGRTPAIAGCDVRAFAADMAGQVGPATPAEAALLGQGAARGGLVALGPEPRIWLRGPPRADGALAWAENIDPTRYKGFRPLLRVATDARGGQACAAPACVGGYIFALGWAREGRSVWFLKGEGEPGRADGAPRVLSALYEWPVGSARPRLVRRADDLLENCQVRGATAYCLWEAPTRPRRAVAISLDSGAMRTLVDPNPAWAAKRFPQIRTLGLTDPFGNPGRAHLVLPYGYQPGRRYPLVIVQYRSRGFLRGGVGDEYPIFPFAAEGYAVLSVDKPEEWDTVAQLDQAAFERLSMGETLRDRRRLTASLEEVIDRLVTEGIADPDRIALTGLSAGAEVVHYALQHSARFRTAIASSGAHDLTFLALVSDPVAQARLMAMFGAHGVVASPESPLGRLAWSLRPEALVTPLLVNVGQYEMMLGFEGLAALRQAGRPVEVRVFPDERHIKHHPRTYRGIYDNNLRWLRFWLKDDAADLTDAERDRWNAMRKTAAPQAAAGAASAPDP